MDGGDIVGLIVAIIVIAIGIIFLTGRGAFLLAGYNTMSKSEKEKYDSTALCKFMGKIFLPLGVLMPCVSLGKIYNITWLWWAYSLVVLVLLAFAVIYANTGNRFRK